MAAQKPKLSKDRLHVINRLKAIQKNLEEGVENFPLDKQLRRALKKLEGRMSHMQETRGYRKALAKRRTDKEHAEAEAEVIRQSEEVEAIRDEEQRITNKEVEAAINDEGVDETGGLLGQVGA